MESKWYLRDIAISNCIDYKVAKALVIQEFARKINIMNNSMASNIANQRIQREFREVVKSEEVKNSGVQVRIFRLILRGHE